MDDLSRRTMIQTAMKAPYLEREEEHQLAVRWKEERDQQASPSRASPCRIMAFVFDLRRPPSSAVSGLSMGDLDPGRPYRAALKPRHASIPRVKSAFSST